VKQHCNAWSAADKLLLAIQFDTTSQLGLGHEYTLMWNYLMSLIILYVYKLYQQLKLAIVQSDMIMNDEVEEYGNTYGLF
jgi:hypothetical protein